MFTTTGVTCNACLVTLSAITDPRTVADTARLMARVPTVHLRADFALCEHHAVAIYGEAARMILPFVTE